jgi:ABC-type transporter Mla subunit MlaD
MDDESGPAIERVNGALERDLGQLLRDDRRRSVPATGAAPAAADAVLERHERLFGELLVQDSAPSGESLRRLVDNIVRRYHVLRGVERDQHALDEDPDYPRLVERFARRLHGQAGLIAALEAFVKLGAIAPLQPDPELAAAFEDMLDDHTALLLSFEALLEPFASPPRRYLDELAGLLEEHERLLDSYADVVGLFAPPSHARLESLENLLHALAQLVERLEDRLKRLRPPPRRLLARFEELLRGAGALIARFAELVARTDEYPEKADGLAVSHARLIDELQHGDRSLARLVGRIDPPPVSLLASLEDLLRELGERIGALLAFLAARLPQVPLGDGHVAGLARHAFVLVDALGELLERFAALVGRLDPPTIELVESFEDLVKRFARLLAELAAIVVLVADPVDPDVGARLSRELHRLVERLLACADLLQRLKERLPEIPDSLLLSDIAVLEEIHAVQRKRLELLDDAGGAPGRAGDELLGAHARCLALWLDLARLVKPGGAVAAVFADAAAHEHELTQRCRQRLAGGTQPFRGEALADVQWLDERLAAARARLQ